LKVLAPTGEGVNSSPDILVIACSARETSPAPLSLLRAECRAAGFQRRCRLFGLSNPSVTVLSKTAMLVQVQHIVALFAHWGACKNRRGSRKMTMLSRAAILWFDGALNFEFFHPFP
jgi:hypothetical protein